MLVACFHLGRGKFNIYEILAERPGKCFLENLIVHFSFFLVHKAKRHIYAGDNFFGCVYITAVNAADIIFVRSESPADFF